jgi:hypothetical protein
MVHVVSGAQVASEEEAASNGVQQGFSICYNLPEELPQLGRVL